MWRRARCRLLGVALCPLTIAFLFASDRASATGAGNQGFDTGWIESYTNPDVRIRKRQYSDGYWVMEDMVGTELYTYIRNSGAEPQPEATSSGNVSTTSSAFARTSCTLGQGVRVRWEWQKEVEGTSEVNKASFTGAYSQILGMETSVNGFTLTWTPEAILGGSGGSCVFGDLLIDDDSMPHEDADLTSCDFDNVETVLADWTWFKIKGTVQGLGAFGGSNQTSLGTDDPVWHQVLGTHDGSAYCESSLLMWLTVTEAP